MTNRMANCGWRLFGLAVLAFGLLRSPQTARAELYGHWPLDDGQGSEARNLAPDGVPGIIFDWDSFDSLGGTVNDPSVWVEDPERGTVLGLNGQAQWVEAGFLPSMDLENDHTWAFWGRLPPEQASPNNDIVLGSRWGVNGSDTSPREFIKFTPNRFEYHMNGGFGDDLAYADSNLPLDQWIHNSVVKDGNSLTYYRNGEFRNSTTISGGQTSGEPLVIGFGGDVGTMGGQAWRGSLDDVQFYTSPLTPAQIATVMTGDVASGAELFVHYPLDEGGDSDLIMGTGPGAGDGGAFIDNIDAGLGVDGNVWVDDPDRGTVLSFAGTFVEAVQEAPIMDLENDFTWNFWSKSDGGQAQTSGNIVIGNRNDFGGADTGEYIKFTNNRIEFRVDGTSDSDLEWGAAGPDDNRMPNDDNWYHHTVVKDGDQMKYYRDGVLRNEVSLGLGQQTADPLPFAMGGQAAFDSPGRETSIAYLSDVRLYDNALTSAEVAALAGVAVPGDCNGDGVANKDDLACVHLTEDPIANRDLVLATIPSLPGDLDGDGNVAFPDFLVLSANFNTDLPAYTDGNVDLIEGIAFADFLILSANFNQTPSAGAALASVPEPSSLALVCLTAVLSGLVRRRRR